MRPAVIILGAACLAAVAHGAQPRLSDLTISPEVERSGREAIEPIRRSSYNAEIVAAVNAMPHGGGYSSSTRANTALGAAITLDGTGGLALHPELAEPAYCSGATYLVFLAAINQLQREGELRLPPQVIEALLMRRQADGAGIWGRWNANGPGTACLFHDLLLGRNFTAIDEAQPGDFAKFWWSDEIGSREHGHSVVFLRAGKDERGEPSVTFWSANVPEGFSTKTIPRAKIRRALFSRLDNPKALAGIPTLAAKDAYLADMLKRGSTPEEMAHRTGLPPGETGAVTTPGTAPATGKKAAAR